MSIVRNVRTVDQYTRPIDTTRDRVEKLINDVQEMRQRDEQRARQTRDTIITCPTPAEWAAYMKERGKWADLGKYYDGISAGLESMPEELRNEINRRLDDKRKTSDAARSRDFDPLDRQKFAEQNRALNAASRERWGLPKAR